MRTAGSVPILYICHDGHVVRDDVERSIREVEGCNAIGDGLHLQAHDVERGLGFVPGAMSLSTVVGAVTAPAGLAGVCDETEGVLGRSEGARGALR